ncbi:RNA-binding protein [Companilactobacillus sp. RD055328]|uniref:YhbY family RNA-binding protein n=1 Tax=Companilactobacillus sp. RD055328 TaxID=2916634 RepID=UPI001FC7C730|nr:YhbY family RNA-binding protein [Companilactobacillus sp. RD055328]GKQ42512.1 RNA-binding protein [Companilactobacillus sp. RD055328]
MVFKTKQRKFLMSKAQTMKPIMQIGKQGTTETVLQQLVELINKRELIKITLLQNTDTTGEDFINEVVQFDPAIKPVQTIGSKVILYKKSPKESHRRISVELEKL